MKKKIFKEIRSQHVLSRLIHNTCEIEHHHLQEIQPVISWVTSHKFPYKYQVPTYFGN